MRAEIYPLQVLLRTGSGWVNRHQAGVIASLVEENRVLKEQRQGRRLRLPMTSGDGSRRRRSCWAGRPWIESPRS
ncbi:MAG: hypothetical protein ACYTFD_13015 [Planctomycetota bacterium]